MHHKIIIIGGGIAGLATALQLKHNGLDALVLESGDYQNAVAGEHLGADGKVVFQQLGVPSETWTQSTIPCREVQNAWGQDSLHYNESIFNPYGDGLLLERPDFDQALANFVQSKGVDIQLNSRVQKLEKTEHGWRLYLKGQQVLLESGFIIDASGRNSKFYRAFGTIKREYDSLIGLTKRLEKPGKQKIQASYLLIESLPAGWWYSTQLGQGTIVATFMTDASILHQDGTKQDTFWKKQLADSHYTKDRLSGFGIPLNCFTQSARSHCLHQIADEHWLCVGDAAMAYDPLSSTGIIKGLRMGLKAADAVKSYFSGDKNALRKYDNLHQQQFETYLEQKQHFYQQEGRWNAFPFWYKRNIIPADLEQFSILPNVKLKTSSSGPELSHKLAYLSTQLPLVDFSILLSCIKNEPMVGKALQLYLEKVNQSTLSKTHLQALESMKQIGLVELD